MWDLIVSVPDHCLSFYFNSKSSKVYKTRNFATLLVVMLYFNILTECNWSY